MSSRANVAVTVNEPLAWDRTEPVVVGVGWAGEDASFAIRVVRPGTVALVSRACGVAVPLTCLRSHICLSGHPVYELAAHVQPSWAVRNASPSGVRRLAVCVRLPDWDTPARRMPPGSMWPTVSADVACSGNPGTCARVHGQAGDQCDGAVLGRGTRARALARRRFVDAPGAVMHRGRRSSRSALHGHVRPRCDRSLGTRGALGTIRLVRHCEGALQ